MPHAADILKAPARPARRRALLCGAAMAALLLTATACDRSTDGEPASGDAGDAGRSAGSALRDVVFVANAEEGTVSIVDADAFREIRRIDVTPDDPPSGEGDPQARAYPLLQSASGRNDAQDLDVSPDGHVLYVSRGFRGDVAAFDIATGDLLWSRALRGFRADHMTIAPDGAFLYVSDIFENRVSVLDAATGEITAEVPTGMWPHDNQITPDGKSVLNTSIGLITKAIEPVRASVFGAVGVDFESPVPVDLEALGIDPGSVRPVAEPGAAGSNVLGPHDYLHVITVFDVEPPHAIQDVHRFDLGGGLPSELARGVRPNKLLSDGRFLYAQLSDFKGVIEYDLLEREVTGRLELIIGGDAAWIDDDRYLGIFRAPHHGLALSGDEQLLCLAARADDTVFIVQRSELREVAALDVGRGPGWATTGPRGEHCYVTNEGSGDVSVISYASREEVARIPVGEGPRHVVARRIARQTICPHGEAAAPCRAAD